MRPRDCIHINRMENCAYCQWQISLARVVELRKANDELRTDLEETRKLRGEAQDRVAVLEREREAVLDKAEKVAMIRVESPVDAIEFVEAAVAQVTREKMMELRRSQGFKDRVAVLEAAQKIRNWHEAPKHDGPIWAVTRIRWVDKHEMWSTVGCVGEFVHDDCDGWLPDQSGEGGS